MEVFPVSKSSQMITFMLQNGIVATLRSSGTEPKIKYYTEFCAAPGKRSVNSDTKMCGLQLVCYCFSHSSCVCVTVTCPVWRRSSDR